MSRKLCTRSIIIIRPLPWLAATVARVTTADTSASELLSKLLLLGLPRLLNLSLGPAHSAGETVNNQLELVDSRAQLAPLLLTENTVGGSVDKEDLLLLRQSALDKLGADNIDCPHLNVLRGDLESLSDVGVGDLAVGRAGGETGESKQAHLALQLLVVKLLLLDPTLVLLSEVVVVLKILLSEDVEKLRVDGLRVAKRLNAWEGTEILEVEPGGGRNGHLESLERILLGLLTLGFLALKGGEGLQNVVV